MSSSDPALAPAFGQAELSNCEREQIHLPGSIQPHGALLAIDDARMAIVQASENCGRFLGIEEPLVDQPVTVLGNVIPRQISRLAHEDHHGVPLCFRCVIGPRQRALDCLLHRSADGTIIAEFLQPGSGEDLSGTLLRATRIVSDSPTLDALCDNAAELFFELTGYDRVMVYEFDSEGHGRVRAETFEKDLEPYLGNRYPATDIPQIARQLYIRNRVRMLVDVGYDPVPVAPRLSPISAGDLDMSMCFLRSVSPIHLQYLANMGVAATLVVSIVVGGKLWGLVACHNYSPKAIPIDLCAACELIAENMATRITAFEGTAHAHVDWSVRRFESHLLEGISRYGDWKEALVSGPDQLLRPVDAGGAALFVDGEIFTTGAVPGTNDLRELRRWLVDESRRPGAPDVISTASLSAVDERFRGCAEIASGVMAVAIAEARGEYLVWFRPEQVRTDVWGGNPAKAFRIGDDPADLSPRRSFAQWHQQVRGTSVAWSAVDLNLASRIGRSVGELVAHFRSVRALIIEDQLSSVFKKVSASRVPILITDARRNIILANEAFQRLVAPGTPQVARVDDLPALFADPKRVRDQLIELCDHQREIRCEVRLRQRGTEPLALMLRGDPVFVAERRVIGCVLMFSDLTELRAVERARQDFQRDIEEHAYRIPGSSSGLTPEQRQLVATIVGNARLAALDITDGQDVHRIPELLDSVRTSVDRALELVDHLVPERGGRSPSD